MGPLSAIYVILSTSYIQSEVGDQVDRVSRQADRALRPRLPRSDRASTAGDPCKRISADPAAIDRLPVALSLEAHGAVPEEIVLDLDATDDPPHGAQEGRQFHAYCDCPCSLPPYVICGRRLTGETGEAGRRSVSVRLPPSDPNTRGQDFPQPQRG